MAGMTMDLDASLGQLLAKVDELGLDDNTYVIYLSDNGGVPNIPGAKKYEKSLNEPLSRGKWDAMEGGLRVPFVVAGPGVPQNVATPAHVWGADLLPTVAELAGGWSEAPDSLDRKFCPCACGERQAMRCCDPTRAWLSMCLTKTASPSIVHTRLGSLAITNC